MNLTSQQAPQTSITKSYLRLDLLKPKVYTTSDSKVFTSNPSSKYSSPLNFINAEKSAKNSEKPSFSNSTRAQLWMIALANNKSSSTMILSDRDVASVILDLPNQSVLHNDCLRIGRSSFSQKLRGNLERILTLYCKRESITYKQGLHELAAPFVYLMESGRSLAESYNLFALFVDKFLPNFYADKDFFDLQCCLRILGLLLQYHDPNLHNFLTEHYYTPEIYSSPWFLTLFASKLDLEMLYLVWDLYIIEQDPYFIFYLACGLLIENKTSIMTSNMSVVPEILSNLSIKNFVQLKQIYKKAKDLRLNTPYSFIRKLEELEIFRRGSQKDKHHKTRMKYHLEYLENLSSIILSPCELLQALYPAESGCSNSNCNHHAEDPSLRRKTETSTSNSKDNGNKNFAIRQFLPDKRASISKGLKQEKDFPCTNCATKFSSPSRFILEKSMTHLTEILNETETSPASDTRQTYHINFIIMDLRLNKEAGYLPKSHLIDPSRLKPETINSLVDEFTKLKGQSHFVLMASKFNSHSKRQKPKPSDPKKADLRIFDESSLIFSFLNALTKKGFPYITLLEGGFEGVTQVLEKIGVNLIVSKPWSPKSFTNEDLIPLIAKSSLYGNSIKDSVKLESKSTFSDKNYDSSTPTSAGISPYKATPIKLNQPEKPNEHTVSIKTLLQRPNTPGLETSPTAYPESPVSQENGRNSKGSRSKSASRNEKKAYDSPLTNQSNLLGTPAEPNSIQTRLTIPLINEFDEDGHFGIISSEDSPTRSRSKCFLSPSYQPSRLNHTIRLKDIMSPQASSNNLEDHLKDASWIEGDSIRASRELFSQKALKSPLSSQAEIKTYQTSTSGIKPQDVLSPIGSIVYGRSANNTPIHQYEAVPTFLEKDRSTEKVFSPLILTSGGSMRQLGSPLNASSAGLNYSKIHIPLNTSIKDPAASLKTVYTIQGRESPFLGISKDDRRSTEDTSRVGSIGSPNVSGFEHHKHLNYRSHTPAQLENTIQSNTYLPPEDVGLRRKTVEDVKNCSVDGYHNNKGLKTEGEMTDVASEKIFRTINANLSMIHPTSYDNHTSIDNKSFNLKSLTSSQYGEGSRTSPRRIKSNSQHITGNPYREKNVGVFYNANLRSTIETQGLFPLEILRNNTEALNDLHSSRVKDPPEKQIIPPMGYNTTKSIPSQSLLSFSSAFKMQPTHSEPLVVPIKVSLPENSGPKNMIFKISNKIEETCFYTYLEKTVFSFYICDYSQKSPFEEKSPITSEESQKYWTKSILIITEELAITVQYDQSLFHKLNFIYQGVPLSQIPQTPKKERRPNSPPKAGSYISVEDDIIILNVSPIRLLLKVTSKKTDPNFISLYFKSPKMGEEKFKRYYGLMILAGIDTEGFFKMISNKEFHNVIGELDVCKDEQKFTQEKGLYKFENVKVAQKCIMKMKQNYTKPSS